MWNEFEDNVAELRGSTLAAWGGAKPLGLQRTATADRGFFHLRPA